MGVHEGCEDVSSKVNMGVHEGCQGGVRYFNPLSDIVLTYMPNTGSVYITKPHTAFKARKRTLNNL